MLICVVVFMLVMIFVVLIMIIFMLIVVVFMTDRAFSGDLIMSNTKVDMEQI